MNNIQPEFYDDDQGNHDADRCAEIDGSRHFRRTTRQDHTDVLQLSLAEQRAYENYLQNIQQAGMIVGDDDIDVHAGREIPRLEGHHDYDSLQIAEFPRGARDVGVNRVPPRGARDVDTPTNSGRPRSSPASYRLETPVEDAAGQPRRSGAARAMPPFDDAARRGVNPALLANAQRRQALGLPLPKGTRQRGHNVLRTGKDGKTSSIPMTLGREGFVLNLDNTMINSVDGNSFD